MDSQANHPHQLTARCCIVGGGPSGMMLGYLLARAGVDTLVLEKHNDFLRDFRGDTVHPSTLTILDELGLLEQFLERPHSELKKLSGEFGDTKIILADFNRLPTKSKFIAFMPQWDFLDFLSEKAKRFPHFRLSMNTEATDLLTEGDKIIGVRAKTLDGPLEIRAPLTIGCDGRHSLVREKAGLQVIDHGAPIDVLWFRITRSPGDFDQTLGRIKDGRLLVTIDRTDYWQCAYVFPKGHVDEIKSRGLEDFRKDIAETVPVLRDHVDDIKSWDDVKLLTVKVDRLTHWSKPGLLCIGDAAHAMSPVGGVGINLAIQDAVAAANLLASKLANGNITEPDLAAVQHRRLFPTRVIQAMQIQVQNRILAPVITGKNMRNKPPFFFRLINAFPILQGLPARLIGLGIRPEHIQSPNTPA